MLEFNALDVPYSMTVSYRCRTSDSLECWSNLKERTDWIRARSWPNHIAAAGRIEQLLTEFPHGGSRADFYDFDGNDPSAPAGKLAHRAALQRSRLLVVCRDAK
jgi:hypothetical protein